MRIPALSIVILFIFSFLIDLYISWDVKGMWKKKGFWIYWATGVLCYALLIVTISLPRRDADVGLSAVMWMLFTYLSIYTGKVFYVLCSLCGRFFDALFRIKSRWYPFRWFGLGLGLSLIGVMWIGAGYTRHHIIVTQEVFQSPNLPQQFSGYRIVQLSDLHVGTWGNDPSFLQNLVDTVNSLHPDLIVFTGDIVNQKSAELRSFIPTLARLKAKDGVYSILGNHDYGDYVDWESAEAKEKNLLQLKEYQRKMGWKMLNNESVYIHRGGDSILLIGVENWGEPPFPKYGDLERAYSTAENSKERGYKLLLTHNPEHWNQEVSKHDDIDLTLSGHTHAMQMMINLGSLKWSPSKYRYEQWGGRFERENENKYPVAINVNIGSGAVGMPARLLSAYPEVTLITLEK